MLDGYFCLCRQIKKISIKILYPCSRKRYGVSAESMLAIQATFFLNILSIESGFACFCQYAKKNKNIQDHFLTNKNLKV